MKRKYILAFIMLFALLFMIAFITGLQNPMGVIVKNQFGASNFLSQLGNFANFIAYAFMGVPAGILLKKIGYKKTILFAIIIGIIGVSIIYISGQVEQFAVYLSGAFVSGFAMCMLTTAAMPLLNSLGANEKKGNQLLQFGGLSNSIGATIVPVLVGYLMGTNETARTIAKANPAIFLAMGVYAVAFLVLYFAAVPEPYSAQKKDTEKRGYSVFAFRHFVLGIIAIFIYVGVEVGIQNIENLFLTTFTFEKAESVYTAYNRQLDDPLYLEDSFSERIISERDFSNAEKIVTGKSAPGLGIDSTIAGSIIGLYWLLMLIGRFLGGLAGGKYSSKVMLTAVSSLAILFILIAIILPLDTLVDMPVFRPNITFGFEKVPVNILFLTLCGLCTSVMWGNIFNLATSGLGKYTSVASGIFMVMVCGGGVLPAIQGWIADKAGFLNSYWLILAGFSYILYYARWGSGKVNKELITE